MELLQVNRQSVYNYIQRLEEAGVQLTSRKEGRSVIYTLIPSQEKLEDYQLIDKDVLRTFTIVRCLQKKPLAPKDLYKKLKLDGGSPLQEESQPLDIHRTQLDKLLRQMLDCQMLTQEGPHGILYPSEEMIPIVLKLSYDEVYELIEALDTVPEGFPYYKALNAVYDRLLLISGETKENEAFQQHLVNSGRKHRVFDNINQILDKLPLNICSKKVAKYTFIGQTGALQSTYLALGMVIYSSEKDRVYLFGRKTNTVGRLLKGYQLLSATSIQEVTPLEYDHALWLSQEFKERLKAMFSISEANPVQVKVEFDNIFNIERKVRGLLSQRKGAQLKVLPDKLIYQDVIAGLPDFANYLRQYGSSCRIIEPEALKNIMRNSVEDALACYKEAGYGE